MLVEAVDINSGNWIARFQVEPGMLPRVGEKVVMRRGVTWEVVDVLWTEHPSTLRPMLAMRAVRDPSGRPLRREDLDVAEIDVMGLAAMADVEGHDAKAP